MNRKIIAVVLMLVLTVASTSCKHDKKNTKEKNGYRVYRIVTDESGKSGERELIEEYEDLISERTEKEYEDGELVRLVKWYYDSTGEHLLKKVEWQDRYPTVSDEYDERGRLVCHSEKKEDNNPTEEQIRLPADCIDYEDREYLKEYFDGRWRRSFEELKTEYTYRGDTEEIATIKSVTESGETIYSLERGDGDIILSTMWLGDEKAHYEGKYDSGERKTVLSYFNTEGLPSGYTEMDYDDSGRCTRIVRYSGEMDLTSETHVEFHSDGSSVAIFTCYDYPDEFSGETRYSYDEDGRLLLVEQYERRYVPGSTYEEDDYYVSVLRKTETYSYYKSGKRKEEIRQYRYADSEELQTDYVNQYDEDGNQVFSCSYFKGESPYQELKIEFLEVPGVRDKVRHYMFAQYHQDESEPWYSLDYYELRMIYGHEEEWSPYRATAMDEGESDWGYDSEFDSDGYLVRTKYTSSNSIVCWEFDRQRRLVRTITQDNPLSGSKTERLCEYWEGDDKP